MMRKTYLKEKNEPDHSSHNSFRISLNNNYRDEWKKTSLTKICHSQKGESIAEVLVAVLVIALGALLLATMVTASFHILNSSKTSYQKFLAGNNAIVSGGTTGFTDFGAEDVEYSTENKGTLTVNVTLPDGTSAGQDSVTAQFRKLGDIYVLYQLSETDL